MEASSSLSAAFEEHRPRLSAMASRMLGSRSEADDALQEAWIRFSRADTSSVDNLGAWLTTVVSRVCLNVLEARRIRASDPFEGDIAAAQESGDPDPEAEALLADSIGLALLIVLDRLTPAERVAFVLHDLFAVPFEEIAPILARSATATRQCASRARRHIRDSESAPGSERLRRARLVDAFLAAAHRGDFAALVELLDPDAVLRCDAAMVALGGPAEARGAAEVATRARQARGARPALIDGAPAAAWLPRGQLRVVLLFGFAGGASRPSTPSRNPSTWRASISSSRRAEVGSKRCSSWESADRDERPSSRPTPILAAELKVVAARRPHHDDGAGPPPEATTKRASAGPQQPADVAARERNAAACRGSGGA